MAREVEEKHRRRAREESISERGKWLMGGQLK